MEQKSRGVVEQWRRAAEEGQQVWETRAQPGRGHEKARGDTKTEQVLNRRKQRGSAVLRDSE